MKNLNELKEWFKSTHQFHLMTGAEDAESTARYKMMVEMLDYIYPEFNKISGSWIQESLNEYYGGMTK